MDDAETGRQLLAARARAAPSRPGVYCFLGGGRGLLYVGKASDLRRRLLGHARATSPRRVSHVREVQWIECADEREALVREADFIAGLAPPFNAVMATETFTCVRLEVSPNSDAACLRLTEDTSGRAYGAFPHLGKGKHSWRAVRTNAGYSALVRLLWLAATDPAARSRVPAKLRGSSPPVEHRVVVDAAAMTELHRFLSGISAGLLHTLRRATEDVPEFMRRPCADDLESAEQFFLLGPHALRRLRLRHGLKSGPIDRRTFATIVTAELTGAIGAFSVPDLTHVLARADDT